MATAVEMGRAAGKLLWAIVHILIAALILFAHLPTPVVNVARINSVETAPVTPPETWFLSFVTLLGQMNMNYLVIIRCRNDRRLAEY